MFRLTLYMTIQDPKQLHTFKTSASAIIESFFLPSEWSEGKCSTEIVYYTKSKRRHNEL